MDDESEEDIQVDRSGEDASNQSKFIDKIMIQFDNNIKQIQNELDRNYAVSSVSGEGKDFDIKLNTCSPYCQSCKPTRKGATSKWCLLECNNVGAARCLPDWCECY